MTAAFHVDPDVLLEFAEQSADLGEDLDQLASGAAQITVRDDAFGAIGDLFGLVDKFHELRDAANEALQESALVAWSNADSAVETATEYLGGDYENAAVVIGSLGG